MVRHIPLAFWAYFERDPELGGAWVAHVLELDLVTQGNTLAAALANARDVAEQIVAEDLLAGRELADRRAPQEYFDKLSTLTGVALSIQEIIADEDSFTRVATQIGLLVTLELDPAVEQRLGPSPVWVQDARAA